MQNLALPERSLFLSRFQVIEIVVGEIQLQTHATSVQPLIVWKHILRKNVSWDNLKRVINVTDGKIK